LANTMKNWIILKVMDNIFEHSHLECNIF
jgi:hypothetical protein